MATIKAFRAVRPSAIEPSIVAGSLKAILEPGTDTYLSLCLSNFMELLQNGSFQKEACPAIYIYEKSDQYGTQKGIWALTNVHDDTVNQIIQHEQTLVEHEDKIKLYRDQVGLEAEPILLTYHGQAEINTLIEAAARAAQPECYAYEGTLHQLWKITAAPVIEAFQLAFKQIGNLYVADGHHRLAAAINLKQKTQPWISTLYIAADQLRIREFNRLIIPEAAVKAHELFDLIYSHFQVRAISDNTPYRPDQHHRMGMCFQGKWYQLTLKPDACQLQSEIDVVILQEQLLKPFFDINDPREDLKLQNYDPIKGWHTLVQEAQHNLSSVAFTLFPMTVEQLLHCADQQKHLPPKSTWIEPKIPYGLLMYHSKETELDSINSNNHQTY